MKTVQIMKYFYSSSAMQKLHTVPVVYTLIFTQPKRGQITNTYSMEQNPS